jgi:CDGSH iron-sulfur domain-containing protein 3
MLTCLWKQGEICLTENSTQTWLLLHLDCIRFILHCQITLLLMARLIRKEDRGPMQVKVGTESKWICMCGLSSNQPFCDGSHKRTADEEAGKIYRYNPDGTRTEIQ